MTSELFEDVIAYHRELASVKAELGRLASDLARLSVQVADLRASWPTDPPHLVVVDTNIN